MKMKFLIVVALLPAFLNAITEEEIKSRADILHKKCFNTSKANMDTVAKIRSHDYDENDDIVRKHIHCYVQEVGFMNANGELNRKPIRERAGLQLKFTPENEEKFEQCTAPKTPDVSVELYPTKVAICLNKYFPTFILM